MNTDLKLSIARINSASSRGTGFLVSNQGLILTCTHVIENWEDIQVKLMDQKGTFTLAYTAQKIQYLDFDKGDITLLQMNEPPPAHIQPVPLLSAQTSKNHFFETFGFPDMAATHGISIQGVIIDPNNRDPNGIPRIVLGQSNAITEGVSGAPIWDKEQKGVIGLVNKIARPDKFSRGEDVAVGIPMDFVIEQFENLSLKQETKLSLSLQELEDLILNQDLKDAIQSALRLAQDVGNQTLITEFMLLKSKLKEIENDFHLGILTYDQISGQRTALRQSLLQFFS